MSIIPDDDVVHSIKGYEKDLTCRGFQYRIGETYECDGKIRACENGFHAIIGTPLVVFQYYSPATSRYTETTQFGERHSDDNTKLASEKITIGVEIRLHDLIQRAVKWVFDHVTDYGAASNSGYQGAASNSGPRGAASNSGYQGAASNSGDQGAASNSGDYGAAETTGQHGVALSSSSVGKVRGVKGSALFLVHRDDDGAITHAWSGIVGRDGIETLRWYSLDASGQPVEVE